MNKEVLRLAVLLAGVALAASRLGLIGHELVAHGGAALAFGARIVDVEMFWFAGGWIRYVLPEPDLVASLVISMAGIALELLVGGGLWLGVRGTTLGRRITRGIGAALVLHATWYLATGAFNGFGDGLILYRQLGTARIPVAIAAGLATCLAAYGGARDIFGPLLGTLPGSPRRQVAGLVMAALLATGLHAALTIGELVARRDPTYAQTMQPERVRKIERELAQWQQDQVQRGIEPTAEQRRAAVVRIQKKHETFPFVIVLAIATVLSVIAGALHSRRTEPAPISCALLGRMTVIALSSIWSVIVIDGLLG